MGKAKFESAQALDGRIEAYFDECAGVKRPPTVHGLALALGFTTARELLNYRGKAAYREAIRRAVTRVGQYAEEKLMSTGTGARYALALNLPEEREAPEDGDVMGEVRARLRGRDGA